MGSGETRATGEACMWLGEAWAGLGDERADWVKATGGWTGERGTGEWRGTGDVAQDEDTEEEREDRGPGEWGGTKAAGEVGGTWGDIRPVTPSTTPPGDSRGDDGGYRSEGEFCEPLEPGPLVAPLVVEEDWEAEEPSVPGGG